MNRLPLSKRVQILRTLAEGNSIASTCRLVGAAKNTVLKLILDVGQVSRNFQDRVLKSLPCKRIECDEIWTFCYAKKKNVPEKFKGQLGYGDVWTYTAICPDTKIVPCWLLTGERTIEDATLFFCELRSKLSSKKFQLTTDGHRSYPESVSMVFGDQAKFAVLDKTYSGRGREGVLKIEQKIHIGKPNEKHISTSMVERQNLTMRQNMRRFTRKTNGHSRSFEYLCRYVDFYFMHYNFIRVHQTLGTTPAVAIGLTNRIWTLEELLRMTK